MSEAHPRSSLFLICIFFAAASSAAMAATTAMLETTIKRAVCTWIRTDGRRDKNNQRCYLFISEPKSFYEANKSCIDEGAHMVSITNKDENALVTNLTRLTGAWIGLYRLTNEVCAGSSCTTWMWLDGSVVEYDAWTDGIVKTTTQCVLMNPVGTWEHSRRCSTNLNFVCEKSIPPSTTPELTTIAVTSEMTDLSVSNSDECKWEQTDGIRYQTDQSCYLFISERKSFYQANESCVDEDAHLVSISNQSENALVFGLIQSDVWIGLYRLTNESCAGRSCTTWMWLDGSGLEYDAWVNPSVASPTQCVYMNTAGTWEHGRHCSTHLSFVCEKSIPPSTTQEPTTMPGTSEMTDTSVSSTETDHFSVFMGVGVFVGVFIIGIIIAAVVCVMKRKQGRIVKTSKDTADRGASTDMGNYENVNMSVSIQSLVISQHATPEGVYVNSITTDSTVSTRNHELDPTNRTAYEEVTNYAAISPEYTALRFTDSTNTNENS